jgi:hypothetical protein
MHGIVHIDLDNSSLKQGTPWCLGCLEDTLDVEYPLKPQQFQIEQNNLISSTKGALNHRTPN